MSNASVYINYFRQLAIQHKDIQHDPASEEENYSGEMDRKRFCPFDSAELITGLRTKMGATILALQMFETSLHNETIYDIRQSPRGAFMVVTNAINNNYQDIARAYDLTEGIIYDILRRIWQDHYDSDIELCARPFKQFRFTKDISPTGLMFDGKYGWYVEFEFDFQNTINITEPPADGTFI